MKYMEKIQTLLPIGYLYLITLGLLKESILYYYLGINILHYSSITDILISPISELSSKPASLIILLFICIFFLVIQAILIKNSDKSWAQKILGPGRFNEDTSKKEIQKVILPFFILFIALEFLSVFVGLGIGEGGRISQSIIKNNYTCNYKANFTSGKTDDIYIFESNSAYYFYVSKENKNIKIAPVGTISSLEVINNKKL